MTETDGMRKLRCAELQAFLAVKKASDFRPAMVKAVQFPKCCKRL